MKKVTPLKQQSRQLREEFGVSETLASLGLAMYVLGCKSSTGFHLTTLPMPTFVRIDGLGPLLFSPLSEIPQIGRNPIYIITFAVYLILSVVTSTCRNFAGFIVVRFLQGFFGSPCLATGAASLSDMVSWSRVKYYKPVLGADNV